MHLAGSCHHTHADHGLPRVPAGNGIPLFSVNCFGRPCCLLSPSSNDTGHAATPQHAARVSRWVRRSRAPPSRSGLLASAAIAVAAAAFRARLAGQAPPFGAADLAAVLATCHRPRPRGRGLESDAVAAERGRLDAVIAGLLFMAGMRRSEVSTLRCAGPTSPTRPPATSSSSPCAGARRTRRARRVTCASSRAASRARSGRCAPPRVRSRPPGCSRPPGNGQFWTRVDPKILGWPGHRPTHSFGVCSPSSRRVAPLRPRYAGLSALTTAPRTPAQTGSYRTMPNPDALQVVVDDLSRFRRSEATVDTRVVPLSPQMVGLRFTAAAAAAGVERRMTAHSGRVGLASELTSRGASTTDVMLAGNWKTSTRSDRMRRIRGAPERPGCGARLPARRRPAAPCARSRYRDWKHGA